MTVQNGVMKSLPKLQAWPRRAGRCLVSSWLQQVEALVSLGSAGTASEGQGTAGVGSGRLVGLGI